MRYYIEQYDGFWSLTEAEYEALLRQGIETGGHCLEGLRELRRAPKGIYRDRDGDRNGWWSDGTVTLVQPLDWDKISYYDALRELRGEVDEPEPEMVRCPACDGFGYHGDGERDEDECTVCDGNGMAEPRRVQDWKNSG